MDNRQTKRRTRRHIDSGKALFRPEDAFFAGDLYRLITDQFWVVLSIAALVAAASMAYAFSATPIYSADALVKVDLPNPNGLGITPQSQQQSAPTLGTLPTDAEIQIIQSREVLAPVIDKYKLNMSVTPRRVPVLGRITEQFARPGSPLPPLFGLDSYAWGGEDVSIESLKVPSELEDKPLGLQILENGRYQLSDPSGRTLLDGVVGVPAAANGVSILVDRMIARPQTRFTVVRFNALNAIDRFSRQLKVMESGSQTGVVQILYETSNPALAALVTNSIAQTYITSHIAQRREEASKMRAFVNGELPQMQADLKQAEMRLSQYKTEVGSMQPGTEYASYLQGTIEFDRQIAQLNVRRTELLNHFMPSTREVRTVDQQLEFLTGAKRRFEARYGGLPTSERKVADLTRDAKVAEDIYVAMLSKSNELAVTQAGTLGNVHIIDTALRPSTPVKPKRSLIILSGTAAGVILGVLFVFVRRQVASGLDDPGLIERRMDLTVFGSILFSDEQARLDRGANQLPLLPSGAHARGDERIASSADALGEATFHAALPSPSMNHPSRRNLLSVYGLDDMSMEELRAVRTALQPEIADAPNNIVLVTGATPGTGKSFVSANLAVVLAETGKRVLLIDGDLRRGHLAAAFGQPSVGGMAEVLTGQLEWKDAIRSVNVNGLSFISTGQYPSNPSELLSTPRMRQLLEQFSRQFDLVIIDTPPVLAVTDANIIAPHAGSTVLVVRPNAQTERELEETFRRLNRAGARVIGAIFNAAARRRSEKRTYQYASLYAAAATPQHGEA